MHAFKKAEWAILMLWKEKDLVVHLLTSKYTEIIKLSEEDA